MELLNFVSKEEIVHCPYNSAHTMPYKTLILHLSKCPDKSKPSSKRLKTCNYNYLHVVHENELEAHEENCLDRIHLDAAIYTSTNSLPPNIIVRKEPFVSRKESWDDDPETTVNICPKIGQQMNVMKPICCLSKAKRKQLRAKLHEQYFHVDLSYRVDANISSAGQNDQQDEKNI